MPAIAAPFPNCPKAHAASACEVCVARPFSVCAGVPDADLARLEALSVTDHLAPGEVLFHQGDLVREVYNVTSGALRLVRLAPDGRRHITGFAFPGDFIGLDNADTHAASAEALERATLCRFPRGGYRTLMSECRELEQALLARSARSLRMAEHRMEALAGRSALGRLADFLLSLPGADPLHLPAPGEIRLAMTHGDVADHLGLTLETVSRSLAQLKREGLIRQLAPRRFRIENPERLRHLAGE